MSPGFIPGKNPVPAQLCLPAQNSVHPELSSPGAPNLILAPPPLPQEEGGGLTLSQYLLANEPPPQGPRRLCAAQTSPLTDGSGGLDVHILV